MEGGAGEMRHWNEALQEQGVVEGWQGCYQPCEWRQQPSPPGCTTARRPNPGPETVGLRVGGGVGRQALPICAEVASGVGEPSHLGLEERSDGRSTPSYGLGLREILRIGLNGFLS